MLTDELPAGWLTASMVPGNQCGCLGTAILSLKCCAGLYAILSL